MRTFIKKRNYLHFIKNCIRPPYKKLKSLKSGFIKTRILKIIESPEAVSHKTTAEEEILIYPLSVLVNRKTDQYSINTFVLEFGILEAYKPIYMPPLQTSKKVSLRII